jgi:hypothetical protein
MAAYKASLDRETGTNNPLVNFIMATEADFFIGALGSTWCNLFHRRNEERSCLVRYVICESSNALCRVPTANS